MKTTQKAVKNVCKIALISIVFNYIRMLPAKTPDLSGVLPSDAGRNSAGESSQYGGISSAQGRLL